MSNLNKHEYTHLLIMLKYQTTNTINLLIMLIMLIGLTYIIQNIKNYF